LLERFLWLWKILRKRKNAGIIPFKWVHPIEEHAIFDEDAAFYEIVKRNAELSASQFVNH